MKVNIIDSIMGSGKTSSIINYINESDTEKRFLYITPYLTEVQRIIESCPSKRFKQPKNFGSKLKDIKRLFEHKENIVSTHALFSMFDESIIELAYTNNYTLIMDEVTNVIEPYAISQQDADTILEKYVTIDPESGRLIWHDKDYRGKFEQYKRLCELGCLAFYGDKVLIWLFPVSTFKAFREIYILTYLFDAQPQKYYYDYYGVEYKRMYVRGDSIDNYRITDEPTIAKPILDYSELIHILDNQKLNDIGEFNGALSKSWYMRHCEDSLIKQLKNNCYNYFYNITKTPSSDNLWTTFTDYQKILAGKGYTKGFAPFNLRAVNGYKNKTAIAYLVNRYFNPYVKNFFISKGVEVDEDLYATSEMLQFIWRSAIRDGNPINIYIPSKRMRTLLQEWIESVSKTNDS